MSASITRTRATLSQTSSTSVTRTTATFASSMPNALTSTFSSTSITSVPISSFISSKIGSTSSLTCKLLILLRFHLSLILLFSSNIAVTSVESSPSASATSSGVTYNKVYVYDTLLITFVGFLCSCFY